MMARQGSPDIPAFERPIRIPEKVRVERGRPEIAFAGEMGTWELPFTLAEDISPGTELKLEVFGGRNNKGVFVSPQVDNPGGDGFISMRTAQGRKLALRPGTYKGSFLVEVPGDGLSAGTMVFVTLGDVSHGGGGIEAPTGRLPNKFFLLHRESPERNRGTWGEEVQHLIVGACTIHILGANTQGVYAYAPSLVQPGQPFNILVRPVDAYGNLACRTPEELVVYDGSYQLEAGITAVENSTCLNAQVVIDSEGIHRLTVRLPREGLDAQTNPVLCKPAAQGRLKLFWGMIHGHTEMSDGSGTLEYYFQQFRNEAGLDFGAPGDHDHLYETSDTMWGHTCSVVARWNTPGEFVTFLGYEWAKWRRNGDGDRNVYYLHDKRPLYRSDYGHCPSPPDLFRALEKEEAIVIPHHTGHSGNFCDWKDHDPRFERLVEIFQVRGSYETSAEEGNPVPERGPNPPIPIGYVSRALAMGWRVGFTAGGDDHSGHAGTDRPHSDTHYNAGLMGVYAESKTREAIWNALRNRRVIATTGPRVFLFFALNNAYMGSELSLETLPSLEHNRELRVEYHGTAPWHG